MANEARITLEKNRKAMSAPALRTYFNITNAWKLSTQQRMTLLGLSARSTFFKWKADPDSVKLSMDTLERISYVLGIYKALQILLPDKTAANEWIHRPNSAEIFGGSSALDRMLSGQVGDLLVVRQYLDAQCVGLAA